LTLLSERDLLKRLRAAGFTARMGRGLIEARRR
jgi:hypothetical protein